jgi:hypothetical protein
MSAEPLPELHNGDVLVLHVRLSWRTGAFLGGPAEEANAPPRRTQAGKNKRGHEQYFTPRRDTGNLNPYWYLSPYVLHWHALRKI